MRDNPLLGLTFILVPFSLLSIGGGPSIFAPLQREVVDVMQWITAREFIDLFSIARVAPGPGAMLATLIGWKVAGWTGAIVATLALFVPASILTLAVARVYDRYRGREWHTALEKGLAPVAVGLIFAGAISIIRLSGNGALTWAAAVGAGLVLTLRPRLHPFVVLFAGAALFISAEIAGLWPLAAP
jgi:chromate transporter